MTVAEVIEKLKTMPLDATVIVFAQDLQTAEDVTDVVWAEGEVEILY